MYKQIEEMTDEELIVFIDSENERVIKQLVSTSDIKEQLIKAKNDIFLYGGYELYITIDNK